MGQISKSYLYWISQLGGWATYVIIMGVLNHLGGSLLEYELIANLITTFILGLLSSHLYRFFILKLGWLKLKLIQLTPRVVTASLIFGSFFLGIHTLISEVILAESTFVFDAFEVLQNVLNLAVIFVLWSLIYFLVHFIQNYRKEEIKNLQWQAQKNEIELNKLKSQLNPHFIFNSMNTIRALVEEDPQKAKDSITQLSNILRSSLLMGRKKVIAFKEELQLVKDYLNLEQTRYEERLEVKYEIDDNSMEHFVPPMLVQTLVENGIKHGVSKLANGGVLGVNVKRNLEALEITIENSGQLIESKDEVGFGLANIQQRLKIIYGKNARFYIENKNDETVIARVSIPNKIV